MVVAALAYNFNIKFCSRLVIMKILTLILVLAAVPLASATTYPLQSRSDIKYPQLQRRSDITDSRKFTLANSATCDSGYYACADSEGGCCPYGSTCVSGYKC